MRGAAPVTVGDADAAFGALLKATRREIDARLEAFLDEEEREAARHGADTQAVSRAVRELTLRGGKRARPALVAAGFQATPGADPALMDVVHQAGIALELLQTYLLVHDDWMDGDVTRRGGPAVHVLLAEHYKNERMGEVGAILAGDYACALAQKALFGALGRVRSGPAVASCFAQIQRDVVFGQILDVGARAEDIEAMHALKTGSYTVLGPIEMGALLAGASAATLGTLRRYAAPLGVAFQLCDDLLSSFGAAEATGKPRGNDLRAGRRTSVIAEAARRLTGADAALLVSVYGHASASDEAIEATIVALERCGARAVVEQRRDALLAEALAALDAPGLDPHGALALRGAARALAIRSA